MRSVFVRTGLVRAFTLLETIMMLVVLASFTWLLIGVLKPHFAPTAPSEEKAPTVLEITVPQEQSAQPKVAKP